MKFRVQYARSSYYEVEVEADSADDAVELADHQIAGDPEPFFTSRDKRIEFLDIEELQESASQPL